MPLWAINAPDDGLPPMTTKRPIRIGSLRLAAIMAAGLLGAALAARGDAPAGESMLGYSDAHALDERALERRFDADLTVAELREWLQAMASAPNPGGSPHDRANAEFMRRKFREWGWEARIETFQVLYPTPKREVLQLIAPGKFSAALREGAIQGDATSGSNPPALPPYNVYGADGDVRGALVYVNYGMPDDYQELDRRGISVRGRIVIARYGSGWRGLKPKLAQEHGAIGCIIYSDPHEDGYAAGDVYPRGGWRPAQGVQRGSVADITLYSGDPLPPDVGATADAKRLPMAEARTLMHPPVLPLSSGEAQPLLAARAGPVAPPGWRGSLPITYHIGDGAAQVHLQVESDWSLKPIYDVIATMPGRELPDEWVVRGNHHDGWVFGAWDPLAGNAALLAEAKSIGALRKSGWRPRRTLIYASWDGEEPGLLGSTEWAETHAQELQHHAVLYVNSDTNARGFLEAGGSPSLQRLVTEISAGIADPQTDGSVLRRLRAKQRVDAYDGGDERAKSLAQAAAAGADLPLQALGSGSDFSPFLQHLGIAALDLGYGGEADDRGIYHSDYDSFDHYLRFGDPGFAYGVAEAQTVGHLVLRVADADVLPLRFSDTAEVLDGYRRELHKLVEDKRQHAQLLSELRQAHAFELASDPTRPLGPPAPEGEVPYLNFAPLDNALGHLKRAAQAYDQAYDAAAARGLALSGTQLAQLDALLQGLEQTLTSEQGLPGRPWYRHLIYAPGLYSGYSAKTMPGVREAIEQYHWDEAGQYIALTAQAIEQYSQRLDAASALLRS